MPLIPRLALVVTALLVVARSASATCNASQLCDPGADPCLISANCTIPAGSQFDVRPRDLTIAQDVVLTVDTGSTMTTLVAKNILLAPGARIQLKGVAGTFGSGGRLFLNAEEDLELQSLGSKRARIAANGSDLGGTLELHAGQDITLTGGLEARGAFGGEVNVDARDGSSALHGLGIDVTGGGSANDGDAGGTIAVSGGGSVTLDAPIMGTGASGGEVTIVAFLGSIVTTTSGTIATRALSADGDGGSVDLTAGDSITVDGPIDTRGHGMGNPGSGSGGAGGDIDLLADHDITLTGLLDLRGAGPDGDGGGLQIDAGGNLLFGPTAAALLTTPQLGAGGEVSIDTEGDTTIAGDIDASGGALGGSIDVQVLGVFTLSGELRADAQAVDGLAGAISAKGCTVTLSGSPVVSSEGPGSAPLNATNFFEALDTMAITGQFRAGPGGANFFSAHSLADISFLPGNDIVPPNEPVLDPNLPCCGGSCPATTTTTAPLSTTTTTTSTTTTTEPPTTTTTEPVPTTTTTSEPVPTTTTSSTTTVPSSTSSTTSTAPPTSTTTTTTLEPSTTTTLVVTTTTSITTTTVPPPTTTTSTLPVPCTEQPLTGYEALDCGLDTIGEMIAGQPSDALGGERVAKALDKKLSRSISALDAARAGQKVRPNLRRARKQLAQFSNLVKHALKKKRISTDLGATLIDLAGGATSEIDTLRTTQP